MTGRSVLFVAALSAALLFGPVLTAQSTGSSQTNKFPWSNTSLGADQRADLLIGQMTLDEKLSLLHGGADSVALGLASNNGGAGFTTAIPRLGIPEIQMADSSYGVTRGEKRGRYSTVLPNNLAAASAWDPQLAFEYGALIGRELRDQGYNMSLSGGVNLSREPRNGRTFEYEGEDPVLAGTLAGNLVRGIQSRNVLGDLKHFAMNDQENGREAVNVLVDKRAMLETDLLAFKIALHISDAGAVMCSYNRVNGDYACENKYLLTDVLRNDWKYQGFVLSDWGATHTAAKASHAGLDMEQPGRFLYGTALKQAVESGEISQEELNTHVHRVLRSMFATGLFEHPSRTHVPDIFQGFAVAQKIAEKSFVLLKNRNNILPLQNVHSVAMIGGHADLSVLSGGGSAQVDPPGGSPVATAPANSPLAHAVWIPSSPLRALAAKLPSANVTYDAGEDLISAAAAARRAQVAIVFAYQWEAESSDLPTLDLAAEQNKLIEAVVAANSRTIVVLETGSPVTMPWIDKPAAVVEAWYPGIRGGEALAEVLTGSVNPSGKLAITFPRSDADLPRPMPVIPPPASKRDYGGLVDVDAFFRGSVQGLPPFDLSYNEGLQVGYGWYEAQKKPVLFPFGFGLSYTSYSYSSLSVTTGSSPVLSFVVMNTGKRSGTEIAQAYVSLPITAGEPPKRLIGWARADLGPGESKQVSIPIDRERLTVYDEATDSWKLVPGSYVLRVGGSSQDLPLEQTVTY